MYDPSPGARSAHRSERRHAFRFPERDTRLGLRRLWLTAACADQTVCAAVYCRAVNGRAEVHG